MDKNFLLEVQESTLNFTESLKQGNSFQFRPCKVGLTQNGERLELGFSCYGLKIYYMAGKWDSLNHSMKTEWIDYINSFQFIDARFPSNSYIDKNLLSSYENFEIKTNLKYLAKSFLNIIPGFNFDSKNEVLKKAINAETKQAISTLHEVGAVSKAKLENIYTDSNSVEKYLDSLDWSRPWSAGAQFSSLCVYETTQGFGILNQLQSYISKLSNKGTGSYFTVQPKTSREIINGAMKVISGLDWINSEIHRPKELIDFCLNNKPVLEGCDFVDYIYVLYKCSKQTSYKKEKIIQLFSEISVELKKLFNKNDGGFSYFEGKSQTHYYGSEITIGKNVSDIHGTLLCLWAVLMILETMELKNLNTNILKP